MTEMSESDALAFRRASRLARGTRLDVVNSLFDEYRLGGGRAPISIRIGRVVVEGPLYSTEEGHYIVVSDSKEIRRYFGSRVDLSSWMRYAESEEHLPVLGVLATKIERVGEVRATLHHPEARCWLGPCRLEYSGEAEELRVFVPGNPEPVDIRDVPPTRYREAALKRYGASLDGWIEGEHQEQQPGLLVGTHGAPMPPRSVALREPPASAFLVSRAVGDERRWYVREYAGTISLEDIAALLREYGANRVNLGVDFLTFFARPTLAYSLKQVLEASPGIRSIDIQMVTRQEQEEPEDDEEKPEVGTKDTQVDPSVSDVPDEAGDEEEVSLIGFKIRFLTNDGEIAEGTVTDEEGDVLTVRTDDGETQEINVDQLLGEGVDLDEEEPEPEPEGEEEEDEEEPEPDEELENLLTDAELLLIEIEEAVTGGYSSRHSHDVAGSSLARKAGKDAMKAASPPTGPGSREKCPEGHKRDEVTGLCVPTQEDLTTGMIASYDKPLGPIIRAPFPQKRKKKRDDDED